MDFASKRKLFYQSNFETRTLKAFELMETIFSPVSINPLNIEPSIISGNWPGFNIVSEVDFTVNFPLVPCILSSVNVKLMFVWN